MSRDTPETDESNALPRHARKQRSHRVARAVGLVTTAVLAFAGTGVAAAYIDLKSSIDVSDVSELVTGATPAPTPKDPDDPFKDRALNILVMGTDLRDAENAAIAGEDEGMRSDTTFVVHVSGDRSRMEVVSIPRDSLVKIPACNLPDGSMSKPRSSAMFNEAFSIGAGPQEDLTYAAACTISTVQTLTGLTITNHVVVKMTGVIGVVDALGGVRMCLPEPMQESKNYGSLDLPAGDQVLDGHTAIQFLRARHGKGMGLDAGSDLTRITRQQALMDAALRQILSQNLITDSGRLYQVIKAALSSISPDPDLADPASLAGLAFSLRSISPSEIVFTELPIGTAPTDKNRVVWLPAADAIWERLVNDQPPPGHETPAPTDSATAGTDPAAGATDPAAGATDGAATDGAATDGGATGAGDAAVTPEPTPTPTLAGVC